MLIVKVNDGGLDKAIKIMKNKVRKTKLVQELRERESFQKPSIKRRKILLKAKYIQEKFPQDDNVVVE